MGLWQAGSGKEAEHLAKRNEWNVKAGLGWAAAAATVASGSALGHWTHQVHLWGSLRR